MTSRFNANCLAVLIGSLPMDNHKEATEFMLHYTPDIPLWVQLPRFPQEGMINQFLPGMPGVTTQENKVFIDSSTSLFQDELVQFYEEYISVTEDYSRLSDSRFALTRDVAKGFFEFLSIIRDMPAAPQAVKGQITGPITMGIGLKDHNGKSVFYDDTLKDVMVKTLSLKARWQVEKMNDLAPAKIIFFDEPGIVSFGSSAYISITREHVHAVMAEVIESVHAAGGLAGIHICANGDWSLALESDTDIISFDAYNYFDKFLLYPELLTSFMESGKIIAWGIIPTSNPGDIEKESPESLIRKWHQQAAKIENLGIDQKRLRAQTLITPSCGTGSLSLTHATKVLTLTKEVSKYLRKEAGFC